MLIGISGSHRVGKTTLCKKYVDEYGGWFFKTNASDVFKNLNLNPQEEYPLETVLDIQEKILSHFESIWEDAYSKTGVDDVLTDRTPLDLVAYLMVHITQKNITPSNQDRIIDYIERCQDVLDKYFTALVIVSPGIDLFEDETKAIANPVYVSLIHRLIMGSAFIDAAKLSVYRIPSYVTDLNERVDYIRDVSDRVRKNYKKTLKHIVKH